jgi:hypothetical protein
MRFLLTFLLTLALIPTSTLAQGATRPGLPPSETSLLWSSFGAVQILTPTLRVSPSKWQLPHSGAPRTIPRPRREGTALSLGATAPVPEEVWRGAIVGAVAGAAFGLFVVNFADCAGSDCATQRVFGVVAFTGAGAAIGAAMGGLRRLTRGNR